MSSSVEVSAPPGLRERKKIKTRASLREHAMRLFREHGYSATTVEQIAEAAEVSPSTFFRYFPSKEDVVLADDVDPIMLRALEEQPADVPPLAALRAAIRAAMSQLSDADIARERERHELMISVPELRATMMDEFRRNVAMLAGGVADRLGRSRDDLQVRIFAGAVIGAVLGAIGSDPTADYEEALQALDFLEAGMPL